MTVLCAPSGLTKAAIQDVLKRKDIPFNTKMTKDQLWALTKEAEVKPTVGHSTAGEY